MSTSSRSTRVLASLTAVALVAGAAFFATQVLGQETSACLEKNQAIAKMKDANGGAVGRVVFGVDSTCKTKVAANLKNVPQGFHGFHVHTTGMCDPTAFTTAGGHWTKEPADHGNHTGDLPSILGMDTGAAELNFLTDRFRARELLGGDGSAVILHASPDNFANIPATTSTGADRYHSHAYNTAGADQDSRATGDAGTRFACGVVTKIQN